MLCAGSIYCSTCGCTPWLPVVLRGRLFGYTCIEMGDDSSDLHGYSN